MFFVSKKKYNKALEENTRVWSAMRHIRNQRNIAVATLSRLESVKQISTARSLAKSALKKMREVE